MSAGRVCSRWVVVAEPTDSVLTAARLMVEHGVGTVVVIDRAQRPRGILTDRDIATRGVATHFDPAAITVEQMMTSPALAVQEATPIEDALSMMAAQHARRALVIDDEGRLVGILAVDDVLELLAEELNTVGRLVHAASGRAPLPR